MRRYRVRRIGLLAGAKFGCVGGVLAALPFGLLLGWLLSVMLGAARHMLEGWQRVPLDLGLAGQISLDVVALLQLEQTLSRVQFLDSAPWMVMGGIVLALTILIGLLGGALGGVGALAYNAVAAFSGGLAIDLEVLE